MEAAELEPQFDTRHLIVPEGGRLSELLPPILSISTERVSELLHLGSVYLNKVRILDDQTVSPLSYIRVHCKPKRYPTEKVDWKSLVVFEDENFVVINKPAGFPVPAAVDNIRETVFAQMQNALKTELFITQRLDVPTHGLMVFGKNLDFQRGFNALLAKQNTYKEYLAKTTAAPALGYHQHYMKPARGAPREVFAEASEGFKECRLEVLSTTPTENGHHMTRIHLMTGRTHQVRAQMKALNCPLWGDKTYGAPGPANEFFLMSKHLRFQCPISQKKMEFSIQ